MRPSLSIDRPIESDAPAAVRPGSPSAQPASSSCAADVTAAAEFAHTDSDSVPTDDLSPANTSHSAPATAGRRIDRPHAFGDSEPTDEKRLGDRSPREAARRRNASSQPTAMTAASDVWNEAPEPVLDLSALHESEPAGPVSSARLSADMLLMQANQIAESLRRQCSELDRREQTLHQQLAQLDQDRRSLRHWVVEFDEQCQQREAELVHREAAVHERTAKCSELEEKLQSLHADLLAERNRIDADRQHWSAEIDQEREQLQQERQQQQQSYEQLERQLRSQHETTLQEVNSLKLQLQRELADGKQALAEERDRLWGELKQERVLFENRIRFQQQHLQKTREDLDAQQTEFRWEQQRALTWIEQQQTQFRLLRSQFQRRRDLLDEQEKSLAREADLLLKSRRALEEGVRIERERLAHDQSVWEDERDVQRADLRRQQDLLSLHAENLESRRQRLDQLRTELEETNRKTLETRLAVEEAYAQLAQDAGTEVAKHRVDEARQILAEYYRFTRDSLTQQRQELEQFQSRLHRQAEDLQTERDSLAAWGLQLEQRIREQEQALEKDRQSTQAREQEARSIREKWLTERREAEEVIRGLLLQLDHQSQHHAGS